MNLQVITTGLIHYNSDMRLIAVPANFEGRESNEFYMTLVELLRY